MGYKIGPMSLAGVDALTEFHDAIMSPVTKDAGKDGIQRQFLYRKSKMTRDNLNEIVRTLIDGKRIEVITLHTKGDVATVYRAID
jgi:hypothetical protein